MKHGLSSIFMPLFWEIESEPSHRQSQRLLAAALESYAAEEREYGEHAISLLRNLMRVLDKEPHVKILADSILANQIRQIVIEADERRIREAGEPNGH